MEKNGLGARNPSVRLVRHKSELFGNKRPKSEVICPGVGKLISYIMVYVDTRCVSTQHYARCSDVR